MSNHEINIFGLIVKTIVVHTVTYMIVGFLAYTFLNYSEGFAAPELACWMRQTDDRIVMAGPLFQPIRGIVFGLVFFPLREILFGKKYGWLLTFWLLFALGILNTFGPAPGSIEGMVYTILPVSLSTYLEITTQSFLLSAILFYWITNREKKWLNWVLGTVFVLVLVMSVMGLLLGGQV